MRPELDYVFDTSGVRCKSDIMTTSHLPPADGFHHAVVKAIESDRHIELFCLKFTFQILAGASKDRTVCDRLFLTEKNNRRVVLFGHRLGLLKQDEFGQTGVRKNWSEAIGKEVVIETATREYPTRDNTIRRASNLTYEGVYRLDDPRVKDVELAGYKNFDDASRVLARAILDDDLTAARAIMDYVNERPWLLNPPDLA